MRHQALFGYSGCTTYVNSSQQAMYAGSICTPGKGSHCKEGIQSRGGGRQLSNGGWMQLRPTTAALHGSAAAAVSALGSAEPGMVSLLHTAWTGKGPDIAL